MKQSLLEKFTVAQPSNISPPFIGYEGSFSYSQYPATTPYPEPDKSTPRPNNLFRYVTILILSPNQSLG
jgi:hypothetical protein